MTHHKNSMIDDDFHLNPQDIIYYKREKTSRSEKWNIEWVNESGVAFWTFHVLFSV